MVNNLMKICPKIVRVSEKSHFENLFQTFLNEYVTLFTYSIFVLILGQLLSIRNQ